jgi:hypothetical protein
MTSGVDQVSQNSLATLRLKSNGWIVLAFSLIIAVIYLAFIVQAKKIAIDLDFAVMYTGGRMFLDGDAARVYDIPHFQQVASQFGVTTPSAVFMRPGWVLPFYSLLALFPLQQAWLIHVILHVSIIGVIAFLLSKFYGETGMLIPALFFPIWMSVAVGQDLTIAALAITISGMLLLREKPTAAGIVLALCLFKFHLFVLLGVGILIRRRWRLASGFFGMGAFLTLMSALIVGSSGIHDYWSLLSGKNTPGMIPPQPIMPNLSDFLRAISVTEPSAKLGLTALVCGLALWVAAKVKSDVAAGQTLLAAMILASPHSFIYDLTILLPGLVHSIHKKETGLWPSFGLAIPISFLLAFLLPGAGIAVVTSLLAAFVLINAIQAGRMNFSGQERL